MTSLSLASVFDSRLRQTANLNLYHVTKFPPLFQSFTVYCFYRKISSFITALSKKIVLDCFYLLIFHSEKFSTDVCCLSFAVNVKLISLTVCLHLCSFPLRTDWRESNSSVDGEPQGNWRWNSNSKARGGRGYSLI